MSLYIKPCCVYSLINSDRTAIKFLKEINPDIEVRIIHDDDSLGLQYTSNFYKEDGAPYQQIDLN